MKNTAMARGSVAGASRYSAAADVVAHCPLPFVVRGSSLPVDVLGSEVLAVANGTSVCVLQVRLFFAPCTAGCGALRVPVNFRNDAACDRTWHSD